MMYGVCPKCEGDAEHDNELCSDCAQEMLSVYIRSNKKQEKKIRRLEEENERLRRKNKSLRKMLRDLQSRVRNAVLKAVTIPYEKKSSNT